MIALMLFCIFPDMFLIVLILSFLISGVFLSFIQFSFIMIKLILLSISAIAVFVKFPDYWRTWEVSEKIWNKKRALEGSLLACMFSLFISRIWIFLLSSLRSSTADCICRSCPSCLLNRFWWIRCSMRRLNQRWRCLQFLLIYARW